MNFEKLNEEIISKVNERLKEYNARADILWLKGYGSRVTNLEDAIKIKNPDTDDYMGVIFFRGNADKELDLNDLGKTDGAYEVIRLDVIHKEYRDMIENVGISHEDSVDVIVNSLVDVYKRANPNGSENGKDDEFASFVKKKFTEKVRKIFMTADYSEKSDIEEELRDCVIPEILEVLPVSMQSKTNTAVPHINYLNFKIAFRLADLEWFDATEEGCSTPVPTTLFSDNLISSISDNKEEMLELLFKLSKDTVSKRTDKLFQFYDMSKFNEPYTPAFKKNVEFYGVHYFVYNVGSDIFSGAALLLCEDYLSYISKLIGGENFYIILLNKVSCIIPESKINDEGDLLKLAYNLKILFSPTKDIEFKNVEFISPAFYFYDRESNTVSISNFKKGVKN